MRPPLPPPQSRIKPAPKTWFQLLKRGYLHSRATLCPERQHWFISALSELMNAREMYMPDTALVEVSHNFEASHGNPDTPILVWIESKAFLLSLKIYIHFSL